jgi:hypothetical protein
LTFLELEIQAKKNDTELNKEFFLNVLFVQGLMLQLNSSDSKKYNYRFKKKTINKRIKQKKMRKTLRQKQKYYSEELENKICCIEKIISDYKKAEEK